MKSKRFMFMMSFATALILLLVAVPQVLANDEDGTSTSDIIALVESLRDDGQLTNESAVRALSMHLTAVEYFEQQAQTDKVVEHMNSFKLLLDHQLNQEFISSSAYDTLLEYTNALIRKWNDLTIVRDGQANAVVVLPKETGSTSNAPPSWTRWTNYAGTVERSEDIAHTGFASLLIKGMEEGGIWQHIDVEPGPISAQIRYYTAGDATNAGQINIGMNLRDANRNNLSTISSPRITLSETSGEWATITLEGDIPETVNGRKVEMAQLTLSIRGNDNTRVYVDDYMVHQQGSNQNLVKNASFETIDYIMVPPTWTRWGINNPGMLRRSESIAHTGAASLLMDGVQVGGLWQHIDVEPGPITAKLHYYTHSELTNEGTLQISMHLRDAANNNLTTLSAGAVTLSETTGEWAVITIEGVVPETVNGVKVVKAQITITANGDEDTQVFVDDYIVQQDGDNLVSNPGFETINHDTGNAFIQYIEKSTGVILPVFMGEPRNDRPVKIYIGHSRAEDASRHQDLLQDMNEHGFIIEAQDGIITILGTTPRATEFGVYEFLERYIGIRWLMPGPDGEHIPGHSTITIPRGFIQDEPFTVSRHFFGMTGTANQEWAKRNRMHDNIQFHHNLYRLFDPAVFADHPEYYPGGVLPTGNSGWQPCFNEETAEAAIPRIIEYFNQNPNATSYSLGVTDGGGYCEEDPDHPNFPGERNSAGYYNMSDIYYRWVNQVVEGVTEVHPDKYFGLLAYTRVYDPPTNEDGTPFKLHPNVVPYITFDRLAWLDPSVGNEGTAHTESWSQSAENIGFYEYLYGAQYNAPRIYLDKMAENYQYSKDQGVIGHVAEIYPNWGEGAKPWISTKLQWNPEQDVEELAQEWYELAVGEAAAPYLEQYYEYWEEFWTNRMFDSEWYEDWYNSSSRRPYLDFFGPTYLKALTAEDTETTRKLMEQVVALAETDQQIARANILMRAFEFYEASILSYPQSTEVDVPQDESAALGMLDELIMSYGMAQKRYALMSEFENDPVMGNIQRYARGNWNGIQNNLLEALQTYADQEAAGGIVGEQLNQFLIDIGYESISASAIRTTASKEEILQTLDFNQGAWTDAVPVNNFYVMDTHNPPPTETNVYLLWDDENLYVGYENFDSLIGDMIVSDEAPNGWWRSGADDSVETFITPDPAGEYLGFFTNPRAVKFARYQGGLDPDVEWEASAEIGTDRWNVIQVIPFDEIGVDPAETKSLQALFFRNYHGNSVYMGWNGGAPWRETSFNALYLVD